VFRTAKGAATFCTIRFNLATAMLSDLKPDRWEVNYLSPLLGQLRRFGGEPCPARVAPLRQGIG
jgi:hypothetical protein